MNRIYIAIIALSICSCSCNSGEKSTDATEQTAATPSPTVTEVAPRDSDIYQMGRRHAAYMLDTYTHVDSIARQLLEVRARETEIETKVDRAAADAYIAGFTSYIRSENPQLADSIF